MRVSDPADLIDGLADGRVLRRADGLCAPLGDQLFDARPPRSSKVGYIGPLLLDVLGQALEAFVRFERPAPLVFDRHRISHARKTTRAGERRGPFGAGEMCHECVYEPAQV